MIENNNNKQVTRWASKYSKCKSKDRELYTEFELKEFITKVFISEFKALDGLQEYGIPETSYYRFINESLRILNIETLKEAQKLFKKKTLTKVTIDQAVSKIGFKLYGAPTLLSIDEEALVVSYSEMKAMTSQPQGTKRFAAHLNTLVAELDRDPNKHRSEINQKSKVAYARRVIKRVNNREPGGEYQVRHSKTGDIKVGDLSNTRTKQSDLRLSWFMFHCICDMYRSVSSSVVAHFDKQVVETGQKDIIEEQLLGPKEVREKKIDLPKVTLDDNVKVCKYCSLKEADAEMAKIEIIPKDLSDI